MLSATRRGLNVRALLESCAEDLPGLRDRALLSAGYDTGLRASELVAIEVAHILEAIDPDARLLSIPRSKGDQEGEGATAYLSSTYRSGDRSLVRSCWHRGGASVQARKRAPLQGAGRSTGSVDRKHLGARELGSAQDFVKAGGASASRI